MTRRAGMIAAAVLLLAVFAAVWQRLGGAPPTASPAASPSPQTLTRLLDCSRPGYRRARSAAPTLPGDFAARPQHCAGLWSIAGELNGGARRFAFQLTLLRATLDPTPAQRLGAAAEAWRARELYSGVLLLTDLDTGARRRAERLSRAAVGLAGSGARPPEVWLEDWRLRFGDDAVSLRARLDAATSLELELEPRKPPLSTGAGAAAGFALPRLALSGTLTLDGAPLAVAGEAWLDRGWGNLPFGGGQLSVDRFTLRLDDGRELLINARRRRDGSGRPLLDGVLLDADGGSRRLRRRDLQLTVLDQHRSAAGTLYPSRWRLQVRSGDRVDIDATIEPLAVEQELQRPFRYWSGAVRLDGAPGGRGRAELSGYAAAGADS